MDGRGRVACPCWWAQVQIQIDSFAAVLLPCRSFGDAAAAKEAVSSLKCLQPVDIAQAVIWCLAAPAHVEVNDVVVRPTEQLV